MKNKFQEKQIITVAGKAMYASVHKKRVSTYNGVTKEAFTLDLVVNDKETLDALKAVGAKPRKTQDGELRTYEGIEGKVFKFTTGFPIQVVDASLNNTDVEIGNGSTVTVEANVYKGVSTMLNPLTVRIDNLIPYVRADAPTRETTLKPLKMATTTSSEAF